MRGVTRSEAHLGHDRVAELSPRVEGLLPAARAQAPAAAGLEDPAQVVALVRAKPPRVSPARADMSHLRNSAVTIAPTVWLPRSCGPVSQKPVRKKPLTGSDGVLSLSSREPNTLRDSDIIERAAIAAIRGKDASKVERHYDVTSSDPSPQIAPELRRDTQSDENTA